MGSRRSGSTVYRKLAKLTFVGIVGIGLLLTMVLVGQELLYREKLARTQEYLESLRIDPATQPALRPWDRPIITSLGLGFFGGLVIIWVSVLGFTGRHIVERSPLPEVRAQTIATIYDLGIAKLLSIGVIGFGVLLVSVLGCTPAVQSDFGHSAASSHSLTVITMNILFVTGLLIVVFALVGVVSVMNARCSSSAE